jgi:signal transduction histidine kinase
VAGLARSQVGDVLLALALAVVGIFGTAGADLRTPEDVPIDARGYTLVLVTALVPAVRRRWPLATLAVAGVATSAYLVLGYPYGPILIAFLVAVYTAARHLPVRWSAPAAAATLAVLLVHVFAGAGPLPGLVGVVPGSAWVVVPYAVGVTVRLTLQSVEQARAEALRQHVNDERLRVAQEVHDVVGHGLAAIKMQADIALHVLTKRPEQAEVALNAISRTSTDALEELRATLAVVRRTDAEASRAPAPGLGRLGDLVQRMADAGVRVEVSADEAPPELPVAVDLAGYRIVQESLTNVLRHSDAKVATVTVRHETGSVSITVTNPGGAAPETGDGLGIAGMRERVTALGGSFSAGPTSDGRFQVAAVLPLGSS